VSSPVAVISFLQFDRIVAVDTWMLLTDFNTPLTDVTLQAK
jgi:hypothetical protein